MASYVPRCSTGISPPSASSRQNACQDRAGTLWACRQCSVVSPLCQVGTGYTWGMRMSRGHGAGTSVVQLAAERPRREKLSKAARERKQVTSGTDSTAVTKSLMKPISWTASLWQKNQIFLYFGALANPKIPVRMSLMQGQSSKAPGGHKVLKFFLVLFRVQFRKSEETSFPEIDYSIGTNFQE